MSNIELGVDVKALLQEETNKYKQEIERLNKSIVELKAIIKYERKRRENVEQKLKDLQQGDGKKKEQKKVSANKEYSEYTSRGVKKKTKVDSIQSYTDFKNIQNYFLNKEDYIGYALWTVGVCIGVRISDLSNMKWSNVLNEDYSFKDRIKIYEQKTNKLQNCLITESIKKALTVLADSISWDFSISPYIFNNPSTGQPYDQSTWYRKLSAAAKSCKIDYHIGTHTMRESFANIVLCVDDHSIDMNAITKIQGLLNHSDPRVTMKYLGKLDEMYDAARKTVSDFTLGKLNVDKLVCGNNNVVDIMKKLDELELKFKN